MLTKAIFTGGVLALLSGSIVYFGIDGADALETEITKDARIADTELAGAASEDAVSEETIVKSADSKLAEAKPEPAAAAEPTLSDEERMKKARIERARLKRAKAKNVDPMESEEQLSVGETESGDLKTAAAEELDAQAEQVSPQPKTKWLDQYLKKTKPENTSESKSDGTPKALMSNEDKMSKEEASSATTYDASSDSGESSTAKDAATAEKPSSAKLYPKGTDRSATEAAEIDESEIDKSKTVRGRIMMKMSESQSGSDTEGEEMIDPATQETMTKKKIVIQMDGEDPARWMTDGNDIDIEMMIEDMMQENDDIEKDVRIFRMDRRKDRAKRSARRSQNTVDYDFVLSEARKLQVVDMRNIAFFEIIDYAVDRKDFSEAADILQELSDPELRDTARAKIGVGLAKIGDSEAAFAVLDEMEIDELTASMRLEIITALMATKAERIAPALRR